MCGRFTREYTWRQLHDFLQLTLPGLEEMKPSYNVAPTQIAPVYRVNQQGARELAPMRWGLIPYWSKDGQGFINARSETVSSKRTFCKAFASQRCLVPASGFYEWKKIGTKKNPYYFRLLNDAIFCFAGIWDRWGEGEWAIETFAILTTEPNELVAEIHDRMPVILRPEEYAAWLDPQAPNQPPLDAIAAEEMEAYPVSRRVNSPKANERTLVERDEDDLGLF